MTALLHADAVLEMSGGDPDWSVFTMSLLDGYHSVKWWDAQAVGRKHDPVVRLWRMRSTPATSSRPSP